MEKVISDMIAYLHDRKHISKNTEISYERDLRKLVRYLEEQKIQSWKEVTTLDLQGYLGLLKMENLATSTISRNIASIRCLFQYLQKERWIEEDPSETLKPPKIEKKASGDPDCPGSRQIAETAQYRYSQGDSGRCHAGASVCNRNACQ